MVLTTTLLTADQQVETTPSEASKQSECEENCLFCLDAASDIDDNLSHMLAKHGFSIPEPHRLLVDVETFLACLDSLISDYAQCLYCMTKRSTSHAVQQHMMAKGHCKIDIDDPESEFRDLYDYELDDVFVQDEQKSIPSVVRVDEHSVRLPSGKVLTDSKPHRHRRSQQPPDPAQPLQEIRGDLPGSSDVADEAAVDQRVEKLNRAERRGAALSTQLDRLRRSDRISLLHLTPAQQRSYLITRNQQAAQAQKAQSRTEGHVQAKGNKFLMKHFSADVKGKMNGIIE